MLNRNPCFESWECPQPFLLAEHSLVSGWILFMFFFTVVYISLWLVWFQQQNFKLRWPNNMTCFWVRCSRFHVQLLLHLCSAFNVAVKEQYWKQTFFEKAYYSHLPKILVQTYLWPSCDLLLCLRNNNYCKPLFTIMQTNPLLKTKVLYEEFSCKIHLFTLVSF